MHCQFCNESIEQVDIDFGEVIIAKENYWHADCFAEYFDVEPEDILQEA